METEARTEATTGEASDEYKSVINADTEEDPKWLIGPNGVISVPKFIGKKLTGGSDGFIKTTPRKWAIGKLAKEIYDDLSVLATGYTLFVSGNIGSALLGLYIMEYGLIIALYKHVVIPLWQNVALMHKATGKLKKCW